MTGRASHRKTKTYYPPRYWLYVPLGIVLSFSIATHFSCITPNWTAIAVFAVIGSLFSYVITIKITLTDESITFASQCPLVRDQRSYTWNEVTEIVESRCLWPGSIVIRLSGHRSIRIPKRFVRNWKAFRDDMLHFDQWRTKGRS